MAIYETYTVKSGNTLGKIAKQFDTSVDALVKLNALKNANAIRVGQVLKIRVISETFYTVKSGDSLGKIASRYSVTVAQIMKANGIANANKISVGQKLIIPTTTPAPTATSISPMRELGNLSKKYEVGGNGPGTVSGGHGDVGGVSYGSYQLASKFGNARKFLRKEGKQYEPEFKDYKEGTKPFSDVWKAIAKREPEQFHNAQHDYIQRTHFDPQVAKIKEISGIDVMTRSHALMDAVWSAAVQHGPRSSLVGKVLKSLTIKPSDPKYDSQALIAIYGERGRTNADGVLVHFSGNSAAVQRGVAKRFRNELRDALTMLGAEETLKEITPEPDTRPEDSRALLLKAQKSLTDQDVHTLIERYGDLEAQNDFQAGKKVVLALRNPTNSKKYRNGRYDDPIIVVWRKGNGSVGLKRFMGNTEPAGIYAWGQAKAHKGSSTDIDRDGRNDLGRLRAGTYHYAPRAQGNFLGNRAFRARNTQVAMRDTNHDGKFSLVDGDKLDPKGAGRSMLIHQGGNTYTWSAGCQTIPKRYYNRFLATLGKQKEFSYILINV